MFLLASSCAAVFSQKTSKEDEQLNNFAEARQRAAIYYDGRDYVRAALQYRKALEYRPKNAASRLGLAYSLMYQNTPRSLAEARDQFEKLQKHGKDQAFEVKRIYGLGLTHRNLAVFYDRRARAFDRSGRADLAAEARERARGHAEKSIALMQKVIRIDDELAARKVLAPQRVSASLKPDAHVAVAHCEIILGIGGDLSHLERAREHIEAFAETAAKARRFWLQRRERLLVTDPLHEEEAPGTRTLGAEEVQRYDKRIRSTVQQEVSVRKALMHTELYLNRYRQAIAEATKILELDDSQDEIYLWRGNAYVWLTPPDYRRAVRDLKEYRRRIGVDRLTDELVALNRRIRDYESKLQASQ